MFSSKKYNCENPNIRKAYSTMSIHNSLNLKCIKNTSHYFLKEKVFKKQAILSNVSIPEPQKGNKRISYAVVMAHLWIRVK